MLLVATMHIDHYPQNIYKHRFHYSLQPKKVFSKRSVSDNNRTNVASSEYFIWLHQHYRVRSHFNTHGIPAARCRYEGQSLHAYYMKTFPSSSSTGGKATFSLHFLFSLHLATDLYRRVLGGFECIVQRIRGQSNSAEHKAVDTFLG